MRKMGLVRDIDLALHIPLRYEDETRIVKLQDAREGDAVQIEATVTAAEVQLRPGQLLQPSRADRAPGLHGRSLVRGWVERPAV